MPKSSTLKGSRRIINADPAASGGSTQRRHPALDKL